MQFIPQNVQFVPGFPRGNAFVLGYPGKEGIPMTQKPKYGIWSSIRFMMKNARKYAPSVPWLCFAFAALSVSIQLSQLYVAPTVLRRVEISAPLGELLGTIVLFALMLLVLNALMGYLDENIQYGRIEVRSGIIKDINDKACATSYPHTRSPQVLKLQEEAMNACNSNAAPAEYIWHTLTGTLLNLAGLLIYLALLSDLNPMLLAVSVATTSAGFFTGKRINEWEYRHREEKAQYEKELHYIRRKTESVQLAKDIRIFGLAPWLNAVYSSVRSLAEAFTDRRERIYTLTCLVNAVLQLARNGIAYAYLIRLTLARGLPASEFLLYFTAFSGFSQWVTGLLSELSQLHRESLELSKVQEYLNLPEPFRFSGGRPIPQGPYELRLEGVTFRYPGTEKEILRHMDLTIRSGEKLAIVGLNGAGKTTLVKLLCGFYDPDEGRVLLNGTDIREYNRREYYALFSAVFQDMSVLDITVAETVAQAVEGIDIPKVEQCLEQAGLREKIASLPRGISTHVGRQVYLDGVEFSGGETQRLMLARALYKGGGILVLDEPTAALDPLAECDIYRKYNEMTQGKTSVFISHRLASTRFCDRILFLKDGGIAEEGTHQALLDADGEYAKLFRVQARYYQEGGDFHGAQR